VCVDRHFAAALGTKRTDYFIPRCLFETDATYDIRCIHPHNGASGGVTDLFFIFCH
jgi:hypothetical protein